MSFEAGGKMPPRLHWLVFGCGGVGGYFGSRLAQCNQKVTFMARNATLTALQKHGVSIESICGNVTLSPSQLEGFIDTNKLEDETKFHADVIVLACKAWDAPACLELCRPWCGPETLVLPLQNGVEGLDVVQSIVSKWKQGHALAGCCNIVSAIQEPGKIAHWAANPPYITFGEFPGATPSPKTKILEEIFHTCPGMDGHLEEDVLSKIWEKFCFICSTTAVQAVCGPTVTQDVIAKTPDVLQMWKSAMTECMALCISFGIHCDKDSWVDRRIGMLAQAIGGTTSCSRDLWMGRPSEVDDLLGSVVRLGSAQEVPCPVISTIYTSLMTKERLARANYANKEDPAAGLPIYPLWEGQKILGTICNHGSQQLPVDWTLVQKKSDEYNSRPSWFVCPMSSAVPSGSRVELAPGETDLAWEVELGIVIAKPTHQVSLESAMDHVGGYVVVLDLTGKQEGIDQMKTGLSWTRNKVVKGYKPMGPFIPKHLLVDQQENITLVCKVNGTTVTQDSTAKLKCSVRELITDASALTPLRRGDILLTGAGALGPLTEGDVVEGLIQELPQGKYNVTATIAGAS